MNMINNNKIIVEFIDSVNDAQIFNVNDYENDSFMKKIHNNTFLAENKKTKEQFEVFFNIVQEVGDDKDYRHNIVLINKDQNNNIITDFKNLNFDKEDLVYVIEEMLKDKNFKKLRINKSIDDDIEDFLNFVDKYLSK